MPALAIVCFPFALERHRERDVRLRKWLVYSSDANKYRLLYLLMLKFTSTAADGFKKEIVCGQLCNNAAIQIYKSWYHAVVVAVYEITYGAHLKLIFFHVNKQLQSSARI